MTNQMWDAEQFISDNRGIFGFIADEDPRRSVDEWEGFVRDLLDERDRLRAEHASLTAEVERLKGVEEAARVVGASVSAEDDWEVVQASHLDALRLRLSKEDR